MPPTDEATRGNEATVRHVRFGVLTAFYYLYNHKSTLTPMKFNYWLLSILLATPLHSLAVDPPTMGWSSWNTYRVNISDKLICKQADAMKSTGLQRAGYKYINIDDGYFGGRDGNGRLITHPERFPQGLKPVVDHIHQLGFKAGIYSDAGRNTCGSYWDKDKWGVGVGMYGHDQQDADFFFKEMGFDFIKVDFCGGDAGQNFDHLGLNEQERYTAIRKAIDATGRKDVRLNVCRWNFPGTWVHNIASSWRISQDINPSWGSVKNIIGQNLYLSAYAGHGKFNDMDMLEIGRGLSAEEEITHFGLWCIFSSPLLIGCDMTTIPESSLRLLSNTELIAFNQDPLGLQARVEARDGKGYILAKDLKRHHGPERAVALYNPTDQELTLTVSLQQLGYAATAAVRDVVEHKDLGTQTSLSIRVPAHGTRLYRLKGKRTEEPVRYEAEHAWLERYQELVNEFTSARYTAKPTASGGMAVGFLGRGETNFMRWDDVYSRKGGTYDLTVTAFSADKRNLQVNVNGVTYLLRDLQAANYDTPIRATVRIQLHKGMNTITMGNDNQWASDVDCFELKRVAE